MNSGADSSGNMMANQGPQVNPSHTSLPIVPDQGFSRTTSFGSTAKQKTINTWNTHYYPPRNAVIEPVPTVFVTLIDYDQVNRYDQRMLKRERRQREQAREMALRLVKPADPRTVSYTDYMKGNICRLLKLPPPQTDSTTHTDGRSSTQNRTFYSKNSKTSKNSRNLSSNAFNKNTWLKDNQRTMEYLKSTQEYKEPKRQSKDFSTKNWEEANKKSRTDKFFNRQDTRQQKEQCSNSKTASEFRFPQLTESYKIFRKKKTQL